MNLEFHIHICLSFVVRVVGTGGSTIRGFLVQARVPDNPPPAAPMLLGSFQTGAGTQQTLDCDTVGAAAMVTLHDFCGIVLPTYYIHTHKPLSMLYRSMVICTPFCRLVKLSC